jgi:hypothetical protein
MRRSGWGTPATRRCRSAAKVAMSRVVGTEICEASSPGRTSKKSGIKLPLIAPTAMAAASSRSAIRSTPPKPLSAILTKASEPTRPRAMRVIMGTALGRPPSQAPVTRAMYQAKIPTVMLIVVASSRKRAMIPSRVCTLPIGSRSSVTIKVVRASR